MTVNSNLRQQKLQDALVEEAYRDYNSDNKVMGEFEKYFWNIWTYDRRLTDEQAEELQDKANFNVRAVMKVIEIAGEEFPFDKLKITQIDAKTLIELRDWYIRWFRPRIVNSIEELEKTEGNPKLGDDIYTISPFAKYCPYCGTKLTTVRCVCHKWCDICKKSLRIEL